MQRDRRPPDPQSLTISHHAGRPRRRVPSGVLVRCISYRAGRSPGPCRLVLEWRPPAAAISCCSASYASQRNPSVGSPGARARCRCRPRQRCGLFDSHGQNSAGVAQQEPLRVVSASPGVLSDRCQVHYGNCATSQAQNFFAASVLQLLASFLARCFLRCVAQPRLQIGTWDLRYTSDSPLPL